MTDTKHTPGPWHEGSHRSIESQSGTICEVYSHMGIAEADANQKLIAAAPELLEAATEMADLLDNLLRIGAINPKLIVAESIRNVLPIHRATIAKATGGAA